MQWKLPLRREGGLRILDRDRMCHRTAFKPSFARAKLRAGGLLPNSSSKGTVQAYKLPSKRLGLFISLSYGFLPPVCQ